MVSEDSTFNRVRRGGYTGKKREFFIKRKKKADNYIATGKTLTKHLLVAQAEGTTDEDKLISVVNSQ
ncbi:hypothetical protein BJP37_18800 [Moorena bouillonii PNG]|uniref:Uncharacterized protein n=1 Tax=Moorena bouillonii PNG TaxID=568701 RepID=A0A1U7N4A7_9CYAN|nr:hypothetical protein BJP37_18800 [Moorena bouillonii PNG]